MTDPRPSVAAGVLAGLPRFQRWGEALRASSGTARIGLVGVAVAALTAILGPLLAPLDPTQTDLALTLMAPGPEHLLGTDNLGRDVFSRLLYGARISLTISVLSVAMSVGIGVVLGAAGGFLGGWVDGVVMRLVDLVLAVPRLVLLVTAIAILRPEAGTIVLLLALTQWPTPARLVRAEILSLKERPFVEAAKALGFSRRRILFRHLLPNALSPVLVAATLGVSHTVILEAGLAFLGLGVPLSWGTLLLSGQANLLTGAWWLTVFPGVAIALVAVSFNLLGDGIREVLDPRGGTPP